MVAALAGAGLLGSRAPPPEAEEPPSECFLYACRLDAMALDTFSDIPGFVRSPRVVSLAAAPNGPVVATYRTVGEDGSNFVDQLIEIYGHETIQLTAGDKSARLLGIGERGEIYFTREDPKFEEQGSAIWMLPARGEPREIFRYKGVVFGVQATETHLFLTVGVAPEVVGPDAAGVLTASEEIFTERESQKVAGVLHDRFPLRRWDGDLIPGRGRLFVGDLPPLTGTIPTGPPPSGVGAFAEALHLVEVPLPPAPQDADENRLVEARASAFGETLLVTMMTRSKIDMTTQVWQVDLANWKATLRAGDAGATFAVVHVAEDGSFAVLSKETPPLPGKPVSKTLERLDLATGERTSLWDGEWTGVACHAGSVFFTSDRVGRGGVYALDENGEAELLTPDDDYTYSFLNWNLGELVALRSSVASPPHIVRISPVTGEVWEGPRLTKPFEVPGRLEEVFATTGDGTKLRAWLAMPPGEGPHPLLVVPHGGPWGSWNDWTWRWNPWVFAARGYATLLPDPGISTGYGPRIGERGHDSIGGEPFTDVMALADAAAGREDIDEGVQVLAGGSYGGYLANWAATHTGARFKAIITHASLWNIESMGRTTDNGSWYRWMMGDVESGPHAGLAQAKVWSPNRFVENIEVPMLVVHGDKDYRVPISQSHELWSDLQRVSPELGHRFLYFPDEGHWILKPGNAAAWYETVLHFLDVHSGRGD